MPAPYKYEKLASVSTIRLIKLESKKIDGQIACTICHAEPESISYDALSYVWGDPTPIEQKIRIKNNSSSQWDEFEVHKNLWEFLNNAWKRKYFDHWFWTDRICLDQSLGSTELGEQIPRMAEIYHNASQVIAWLGLKDSLGQHLVAEYEAAPEWQILDEDSLDEDSLDEDSLDEVIPEETEDAICAVRDAEYWQRVWVVQELVSAKQIVTVVADLELEWDKMLSMLKMYIDHNDKVGIFDMMRGWTEDGQNVDLWTWLKEITGRGFQSTYHHDLVYGILGLATTYGNGKSKSRPDLIRKADYREHHAYVIINALFESFPNFLQDSTSKHLLLGTSPILRRGIFRVSKGYVNSNYLYTSERHKLGTSSIPDSAIFTVFKGYLNSTHTSERHKQLANFFLQTCDALFSILPPERPELNWPFKMDEFSEILWAMIERLGSEGPKYRAEYAQHTAILLGFALVFYTEDGRERRQILQDWKVTRDMETKTRSLWKCRNHLPPLPRSHSSTSDSCEGKQHCGAWNPDNGNPEQNTASGINASVSLPNLNPHLKLACNSYEDSRGSSACHESIVAFQIPEAGFRLELELSRDDSPSGLAGKGISVWFWPPEGENEDPDSTRTNE